MQIIPAIDLKDNKCVRLSEGQDNSSVVFNNDPKQQALYFEKIGCKKLHIVDLDAAFGRPNVNLKSIKKIRNSISIPIQLGGGIRSQEDVNRYFDLGIENLIIGSMSVENPEIVKSLSSNYKNKIYISLDIKDNNVMVRGWEKSSNLEIQDIINLYEKSEIKGYIVTDIKNDGMLKGLNIKFINNVLEKIENKNNSKKSLIIAGGLTSYSDLENLKKLNIKNMEGVIAGKSFYVGNIDLIKGQMILNSNG